MDVTYVSEDVNKGTVNHGKDTIQIVTGNTVNGSGAEAKAGYKFTGWYKGETLVTEENILTAEAAKANLNKNADGTYAGTEYVAKFTEKDKVTLYYVANPEAGGTVSRASEDLAPATGVAQGSTATANPGYKFVNWTVNRTEVGTDATLSQAEVDAAAKAGGEYVSTTFTANFVTDAEQTTKVHYVAETGGSVTTGENDIQLITAEGLTGSEAAADNGYKFTGWYKDGNLVTAEKVLTAETAKAVLNKSGDVYTETTFTAKFEPDETQIVKVTYISASETAGTVTNSTDDIQIITADGLTGSTAIANEGYAFAGWYKGTELVSSATNLDINTAKAHLNKAEDGTYVATEFVAHWKGLEVTKVVDVIVDKDGNKQELNEAVSLNDTITYKITVQNIGTVDLTDIEVSDELAGVQLVSGSSWTIRSLAAGATGDPIYVTYRVKETDLGKDLKNVATAAVPEDPEVPVKPGETTNKTDDVNPSLAAKKTIVGTQESYGVDDEVLFNITVTNNGNVTLTNIIVSELLSRAEIVKGTGYDLTNEGTAKITTLAPGAGVTVNASYVVQQDDVDNGNLKNIALVEGEGPDGNNPESRRPEKDVPTDEKDPQMTADKSVTNQGTAEGGKFKVGETAEFEIAVTNQGNVTLKNVTVTENLENAIIDEDSANYTVANNVATIASILPGKTIIVKAHYVVAQEDIDRGTLNNIATVIAPGTDPKTPSKPVPMEDQKPSYTVEKNLSNLEEATGTRTAEDGTETKAFKAGETAKFDITVENTGNVTLTDIEVKDILAGATLLEGTGYTFKNATTAVIAKLAPTDEPVVIKAEYVVTQTDVDNGGTVNTVTTDAKGPGEDPEKPEPPKEPIPTEEQKPSYTVVKNLSNLEEATGTRTAEDGTETKAFKAGETAKFDITVENTGNVTLTDIEVKDILAGATLLEGTGYTFKNATTAVIAKLAPTDEPVVIKAEYVVTQTDVESGGTENLATSTAKGPGDPEKPTPVDPGPIEPEPVPTEDKKPAFEVDKELTNLEEATGTRADGSKGFKEGETATFNVTVRNTGNVTLNTILVTEGLNGAKFVAGEEYTVSEDGKTATIDTLAVKGSEAGVNEIVLKAEYTVTQKDILNGNVANTVTAEGKGPGTNPENPEPPKEPIPTETPSSALKVTKTVISKGSTITVDGKDVNGYRVGDTIEFKIHVENTGNITLNNIVVNDIPTLDAGSPKGSITIVASTDGKYTVDGSTATIATLAPKAFVDIKASYLVMAGDGTVKGNKLFNTAFATGTSEDPNNPQPGDSSKTDPVPIEPEPDDGNGAMEGSITVTKMITTSNGKTPKSGVNAAIKVGLYDNASFSGTPIAVNTITISNATSGNTVFNELDNTANTTYYVAELDANNQPIVAANAHLEGYGAPAYSDNCKKGINPTTATDTTATIINPLEASKDGSEEESEKTSTTTSSSSTSTKSSTAAKTGDDTNMMIYWLLLGIAIMAGCTAVVYRKKKER